MSNVRETMHVPLLDLKAQYATIRTEIEEAVRDVLESQHFILGPKVSECEALIARYSRSAHAVGVSSGSDALLVCLMAERDRPRRRGANHALYVLATARAIARVGARPVFVDICPRTYNIDPAQIAAPSRRTARPSSPYTYTGNVRRWSRFWTSPAATSCW